jgi:hypothetical protein
MTPTCTWCGHASHAGTCREAITAGILTGHTGRNPLPRRHAGKNGEQTTKVPCPCAKGRR